VGHHHRALRHDERLRRYHRALDPGHRRRDALLHVLVQVRQWFSCIAYLRSFQVFTPAG
jgi:hypothetical protein